METLFITQPITKDIFYLVDSRNFLIARFNSEKEAENWCKENGYKVRKQN